MADVQISEADAVPSPFSLAEQWVNTCCNYGNKCLSITVEQK
jgi:hypothetical protein